MPDLGVKIKGQMPKDESIYKIPEVKQISYTGAMQEVYAIKYNHHLSEGQGFTKVAGFYIRTKRIVVNNQEVIEVIATPIDADSDDLNIEIDPAQLISENELNISDSNPLITVIASLKLPPPKPDSTSKINYPLIKFNFPKTEMDNGKVLFSLYSIGDAGLGGQAYEEELVIKVVLIGIVENETDYLIVKTYY